MKYIYILILIFVILYFDIWLFNHINAWVGIGSLIITGIFLTYFIKNSINKHL